jgi:hypothetical protein
MGSHGHPADALFVRHVASVPANWCARTERRPIDGLRMSAVPCGELAVRTIRRRPSSDAARRWRASSRSRTRPSRLLALNLPIAFARDNAPSVVVVGAVAGRAKRSGRWHSHKRAARARGKSIQLLVWRRALGKIHLCFSTGRRPLASKLVAIRRVNLPPASGMRFSVPFPFACLSASAMSDIEIVDPLFTIDRDHFWVWALTGHFVSPHLAMKLQSSVNGI